MWLTYLGKKKNFRIGPPFLSREYVFPTGGTAVEIDHVNAKKLVEANPKMFLVQTEEQKNPSPPKRAVPEKIARQNEEDNQVQHLAEPTLKRMTKEDISDQLQEDFEIDMEPNDFSKDELISKYLEEAELAENPE